MTQLTTPQEQLDELRQCIANRIAWRDTVRPGTATIEAKRDRALQALRDLEARLEREAAGLPPPCGVEDCGVCG